MSPSGRLCLLTIVGLILPTRGWNRLWGRRQEQGAQEGGCWDVQAGGYRGRTRMGAVELSSTDHMDRR
ncbi:FXYD domain containing ion transport regulator 5 [Homo sapiens]|uniref:FXYD domain containing ion transport regulator 5 n=1 Tax=Homo sapiens TaxID=9606 RepID=K7ER99_HUMAN|nr:FXYD domain containing ion transport regulator 5 [Homo sapiens]KAI4041974.1 FXYD domain containing ion transport regulator 5 [Homo sapiens]